jgi:hypothetical protein
MAKTHNFQVRHILRRAFSWELRSVQVTESERSLLHGRNIHEETLHRYAVWRRSVLWVVLLPTLLAAILASVVTLSGGRAGLSTTGRILTLCDTLVIWALPISAWLALRSWLDIRKSQRVLITGWLITFVPPFLIALVPFSAWMGMGTSEHGQHRNLLVLDMLNGMHVAFTLLPTALAILPGLVNACLRVKTLLPPAILPGWFLMVAPPFYLLLVLLALIVLNQAADSPILIVGVLFLMGSPLLYLWRHDLFVRPLAQEQSSQINRVHRQVKLISLAGLILLVIYLATQHVFGLRLVGINPQTSLVWLFEHHEQLKIKPVESVGLANSVFWVGDIRLSQLVVQYCGRTMFMAAVFADLLVLMNLSVWSQEKRFAVLKEATAYDATMGELQRMMG